MAFKIESIPKPEGRSKYPFNKLQINESFFVPNMKQATIGSSCIYWSKRLNRKFTTSLEGSGVRVFRTK